MRVLVSFLAFIFALPSAFSANLIADSLRKEINSNLPDTTKSIVYLRLASTLENSNIDSSVYYAERGLELAKNNQFSIGIAENAALLGDYAVRKNELNKAKEYYFLSIRYFELLGKTYDYVQTYLVIGNIYNAQNNYIEALKIYQSCLGLSINNEYDELAAHLYNNIGVLYLDIEDYESAILNFQKAYDLFLHFGEKSNIAHALSNMAVVHGRLGENEKAIKGYLDGIRAFSELGNWMSMADGYNSIALIYLNERDLNAADKYLNLGMQLLKDNNQLNTEPSSIYSSTIFLTAAKIAFEKGETDSALDFAQKSLKISMSNGFKDRISESAKIISSVYEQNHASDSALKYFKMYVSFENELKKDQSIKQITQLKMQNEFDYQIKEAQLAEVKRQVENQKREYTYLGVIAITIFLSVLFIMLYWSLKIKSGKTNLVKENLELERLKLNQELEYKNRELTTNMLYLVEKNEFINTIAQKLSVFKSDVKSSKLPEIQQIINELKKNSSKKTWEEFELRFNQVHSKFYEELNEKVPDLSPNEKKLCAFLKLNMSTKEISAITHQSIKSINMARFRLRKKLNLDRDENLISFLESV